MERNLASNCLSYGRGTSQTIYTETCQNSYLIFGQRAMESKPCIIIYEYLLCNTTTHLRVSFCMDKLYYVRFEVFMAMKIQVRVFWVVTPCGRTPAFQRT
jgi:hypothetical protein